MHPPFCFTAGNARIYQNSFGFIPNVIAIAVTAFPKLHDAIDPQSFVITCNGITIGVFTDIGASCAQVAKHFGQCHAAFLESNYDEQLLEGGKYPQYLKNRIRGGKGHLSNNQALEIFKTNRPSFMTHLLLSHLSKDNNDPLMAHQLFNDHAGGTQIIVASRYKQTAVYSIENSVEVERLERKDNFPALLVHPRQLSLF